MSFALIPNHSPEHMAKMARAAGQGRTFTEQERLWITEHWVTAQSIADMSAHLKCRTTVLKREAKMMGLPTRGRYKKPKRASQLRVPRKYNKANAGCERRKDVDGEKSSPPPAGILYACPNPRCGFRCADPLGHPQCVAKVA
jgi:hypothetical protein